MKTILLLMFGIAFTDIPSLAEQPDSLQKTVAVRNSNLRLQTRLHSLGVFYYGGRIVSTNPTIDFNFTYDRKTWGLQLFKALDLRDSNTPLNFTLAVVNKNFRFGKRLTVTPSAGFTLEQRHTVADHGSDVAFILTTGFKLTTGLTIEHSAFVGNLVLEPELKDWVNRFRLMYSHEHLDLTAWAWHNNKAMDPIAYTTLGLSCFYSRLKVSRTILLNAGLTGIVMPHSSDEISVPKNNGVVFTLTCVID